MKTLNCYSDLLEMVFPEKLEMFGKKKRIKNKEQRKWALKVPKKRQAKRKLKTLPVARTGSRSKT